MFNWNRMGTMNSSFTEVTTEPNSILEIFNQATDPYNQNQQNEIIKNLQSNPNIMGKLILFVQASYFYPTFIKILSRCIIIYLITDFQGKQNQLDKENTNN
jgi:hypothetical protein